MSNGLCSATCTGQYAYAVILGQTCYCSNYIPTVQVSTDYCHDPCPGYPPDFCGNATSGYYAYFNLGRAASGTVQFSMSVTSSSSMVAASTTAISTSSVSPQMSAASSTSSLTSNSTSIAAIQQYIQSALATQSGTTATDACFLNVDNTLYTSPSWYQNAPTQVQSYFSSTHRDTSATCAALADTLFARDQHHGLSGGAKAGIIVGSILGALLLVSLIVLLCLCLRRRKRRSLKRNGGMDESMDDKPIEKHVAAAPMPTQFDNEHSSEHDMDDPGFAYGMNHEQPLYYSEATVTPSATAPALTYFGSPASPSAVTAATLAWGRGSPQNSSAQRIPAYVENSVTESQGSSVYETPFEAPPSPPLPLPTHIGQQGTRTEPSPQTNTGQDYYIMHQQNPYQFPRVPVNSTMARNESQIPRKPVGILKNRLNNGDDERMTALPRLQRDSEQYTFYDEHGDGEYPYHAR